MAQANEIISLLSEQHGLASAALFRPGEITHAHAHGVLLDGAYGTFAVSTEEVDRSLASSWAWSANIAHHVSVLKNDVEVVRWDRPLDSVRYSRRSVFEDPAGFYDRLRDDRVGGKNNIVRHAMDLFLKVRNLTFHSGLADDLSIPAYLEFLAALMATEGYDVVNDVGFALSRTPVNILSSFRKIAVDSLMTEFRTLALGGAKLVAFPQLAIRHASGAIFQEAHHQFEVGKNPDLFGNVPPARSKVATKGVVHFTPPSLARALAEQSLGRVEGLHTRIRIVIGDIACGSGAFLLEALRALERLDFQGEVTLLGRDTSPIAIDMARFALNMAGSEWPGAGRFRLDLREADTLRERVPPCDVIVMNPPFRQWNDMTPADREIAQTWLRNAHGARPDLSMVFVTRALDGLAPDGVLATLLPANVMEAAATREWRRSLAERLPVALAALFEDQRLFQHASVRVGALVLAGRDPEGRIEMRAEAGPYGTGDALRALRKFDGSAISNDGRFQIERVVAKATVSWRGVTGLPKHATIRARRSITTSVRDLFDVVQGIRTGENQAFVLSESELLELPHEERGFFLPAISSRGIDDGELHDLSYVFFPYPERGIAIHSEEELSAAVPTFFERRLEQWREKLSERKSLRGKWWLLTRPRRGLLAKPPVIVSKYFADPGGFVLADPAVRLVLQGQGWVPTKRLAESLKASQSQAEILGAYLAIFNSKAFFQIVAENAPRSRGGQRDMSLRYIAELPLPDLFNLDQERQDLVNFLHRMSIEPERFPERKNFIEQIASVFLFDEPVAKKLLDLYRGLPPLYPHWLQELDKAGERGIGQDALAVLFSKLRDLAERGDYREIDAGLERAEVQALAQTSFLALLRGTYAFRSKLVHWSDFKTRVEGELNRREAPTRLILAGLDL